MKIGTLIKKAFSVGCIYFTLITAVYSLLAMIVNVDDERVLIDAARVLLFFVASLLFAAGNAVLKLPKPNGALRVFLHYLIYLFAFCACFMLPISPEASGMIIGITLFTLIYAVSMAIVLAVKSRYKRRDDAQSAYDPKFKK